MTAPTITDAMVEAACRTYENHPFVRRSASQAAMRAALEAAERAAWRPIEEAPKDGTALLVWDARWKECMRAACTGAHSDVRGDWFSVSDGYWLPNPTHFRPLPPPPEGDGK